MNQLHEIISADKNPSQKRRGRGNAAGGGNTSGRGNKGQKARTGGSVPARFEGGQTPYYMRIAKKKGFKHHRKFRIMRINLKDLAKLAKDGKLIFEDLVKTQIIKAGAKLKILGEGDIKDALQVQAHYISKSALDKIEKAGGKVEILK
ncbi:MAG: 50S ribosomal protein L15 [Patescibacteria group bacterium]|nr:50S ribosomal protein L15 [Patescibacteria group bacterium]